VLPRIVNSNEEKLLLFNFIPEVIWLSLYHSGSKRRCLWHPWYSPPGYTTIFFSYLLCPIFY